MKFSYDELERKLQETLNELTLVRKEIDNYKDLNSQLKISEDKFHKTFDINPSFMTITEIETGKYIDVNESFERVSGFTRNELIGKTSLELGITNPELRAELFSLLEKGINKNLQAFLINKKKEKCDITLSYDYIHIFDKIYLLTIGYDITDKLKLQSISRHNFEELFTIFSGFEGFAHVMDMADYKILAANKYTENFYGKNLVGDYCYNRYHAGFTAPCTFCKNHKLIDENGNPKEPLFSEFLNPVNGKWYQCFDRAIRWTDGRLVKMQIAVDITDKKKTEEKLKQTQEQYYQLVENAVDAIFHGDTSGNFIGVNPRACEMTGYTKEELMSMNMGQLFTPEQVTSKPLRYDLLKEGHIVRTERIIIRKDGSTLPIEMNTKMMPDKTYQSFFRDFSERKKMEDELVKAKEKAEESERLKSAFLANMSHEIRTPLNGIIGFADILINDNIVEAKRKEFLEIIGTNGKQLLAIINDIIDISKIEAGQVKVNSVNCFLNQLMFDIYTIFNSEIEEQYENKVKLNLLIPSERSILIHADDVKITQVLNNLIGNAIKFTHQGNIDIGYNLDIEKYTIEFFVRDSGIGLSKEKQSIIFERFRQADDTTTRNYGGTGLGLAISKGLVELMGGKIWVQSDEGKETVFYFSIPYNPIVINEAINEPEKKYKKCFYDWTGKSILIVEDDNDSYLYLETLFEKNKANIYRAENGKDAVDFCKKNKKISIVLMDIQTPVMNGYEATKLIREFNTSLPIIAQTANAFAEDREKCLSAGCNDYIMKPIDVKLLYSMIDSFLEKN